MKQDFYEGKPIQKPVKASVQVPGSKSVTNRALLLAALADGWSQLDGALVSDDAQHFLTCLKDLGFEIRTENEERTIRIRGLGGKIPQKSGRIYVGSAGTAARFLTAMLGFSDGEYLIDASSQMKKRPMKPLLDALRQMGVEVTCLEEADCLPVRICGNNGFSKGCMIGLDISESTQFLSALLMTAPMLQDALKIRITSQKTDGAYVRITRRMMQEFGVTVSKQDHEYMIPAGASYQGRDYEIEPDVSGACYFYAAAAVCGGEVTVAHVHPELSQGDLKFLDVLCEMGCIMEDTSEGICLKGPRRLRGVCVNMNDFSDQALTLAAIAPFADAPVEITGIAHIRGQECDRIHAIASNLARAGIQCEEWDDGVKIFPGEPKPCEIETFSDHRVAMSFALMGLRKEGIRILDPGCCAKTFPVFFQVLDRFRG